MLISFSATNYRSIQKRATIDFRTDRRFSQKKLVDNFTVAPDRDENLLFTQAVFGANASGKSNLLNALGDFIFYVRHSHELKGGHPIPAHQPFSLALEEKASTTFEIEFIAYNDLRYQYHLEISRNSVVSETLYFYGGKSKKHRNLLFQRNDMGELKTGELYRGPKGFNIYENQLVLSQTGITPNPSLLPAYRFFDQAIYCYTFHDTDMDDNMVEFLKGHLDNPNRSRTFIENLNRLLRAADTSIEGIEVKGELDKAIKSMYNGRKVAVLQERRIKTIHRIYDDDNNVEGLKEFDLVDESTGTQKLLMVGGIILDALQRGRTIVFDELDKSLHPLLTKMLISLFHDPEININGAQLLLATHDAALMDKEIFRLDQIVVVDKQLNGNSVYSKLSSFSGLSKAPNLDDWYLLGTFGGTPMINEFELDLEIEPAA